MVFFTFWAVVVLLGFVQAENVTLQLSTIAIATSPSTHKPTEDFSQNDLETTTHTRETTRTVFEEPVTEISPVTKTIPALKDPCPDLRDEPYIDSLTQEQFTSKLTDSCRYDQLIRPPSDGPLNVYMQMDLMHIESADQVQFKAHMLIQYLYRDVRLKYDNIAPKRGPIVGETLLRSKVWVPHVMIRNEKSSSMMGLDGKDVFVSITPQGDVVYSYRISATYYCWMNLQKFPFDSQNCFITWHSWTYNTTNMVLKWDLDQPVKIAKNLHLTEFVLSSTWTEEQNASSAFSKGGLVGNFSELVFRFKLKREVGYYIMDYFLPSILLVCTSWVTFWLQADAAPPRVTLGTATMLAFITLNGGLTKNLPKVSYIKASEIWFLACACFIFCSMAEFAFVNVIWRRKKKVELQTKSSKNILIGALTPSLARKQLRKAESINSLYKPTSCSSLDDRSSDNESKDGMQKSYLNVHGSHSTPTIKAQSDDGSVLHEDSITSIPVPEDHGGGKKTQLRQEWQTMTPHEVSNWIDKKSRIVFPVSFIIFNIFYWSFVYVL